MHVHTLNLFLFSEKFGRMHIAFPGSVEIKRSRQFLHNGKPRFTKLREPAPYTAHKEILSFASVWGEGEMTLRDVIAYGEATQKF